ncbi:MAG TPA: WXG100 family type VII secretion target [Streptosporangiaceae bacterium]
MSDSIFVNYGNVTNVGQALADANNAIGRVIQELQDIINPLQATWSGASQSEYTAIQARWNADTGDMSALLSRYGSTLDEMSINYGTTDNNLALQWSAIK